MTKKNRYLSAAIALTVAAFATSSGIAAQGPQPSICVRSCWGARAATSGHVQMSALTRAIIHHTAGSSDYTTNYETAKSKVRGVQNVHMDGNGWSDIGYHFLVSAGGHIFEGRAGSMTSLPRGAHDGSNVNSFGFTLLGYFHTPYNHDPNATMRSALYDVIAWRMPSAWSPYGSGSYNSKTVGYLDGHRKVKATACPGDIMHVNYITENYNGGDARNGVNARKNPAPSYINPPYGFDANAQGWVAGNSSTALAWSGSGWPGIIYADQTGNDCFWYSPETGFTGGADATVHVSFYPQSGTTASHDMQVFWKTSAENFFDAVKSSPIVTYTAQNNWFTLNLPVASDKWSGDTIKQLRLDFDNNNSGTRWIVNHVLTQTTPKYWLGANASGWTVGNGLGALTWTDCCGWPGIIYADQTAADAFFYSPTFSLYGGVNDRVRVRVFPQGGGTANHDMQIFWKTTAENFFSADKSSAVLNYTAQDAWADLTLDVGNNPKWNGAVVTQIRLDVDQSNTGVRWLIDYAVVSHATAANPPPPPPPAPAAPSNLAAAPGSSTQINLSWTDNSSDESNFIVARGTASGGPYTDIATLGANATTYGDSGLTANTAYYYVVRAVNANGASPNSNQASATTYPNPPAAPSGLSATAVSATQINLSWTDNSSNETSFTVARSTTSGGPYTDIAVLGANTTSHNNTGLTANTTYYYVVRAANAGGSSANSAQASATTFSSPPAAPSGLATSVIDSTQINLSWTDNSSDESNFVVGRSTTSGGPYTDIATLGANTTTYSATGLAENTTYYFVVRAVNAGGSSANSAQASGATPLGVFILDNAGAVVVGSWSSGSSAGDKYGADYRFKGQGTGAAYHEFTPAITTAGNYQVFEWHPQGANRTLGAPHVVAHSGGTSTVNVNQQVNGGTWNLVGTYHFASGTAGNIRITDAFADAGQVVIADAVRLVYVPAPTAPSGLTATAAGTAQINLTWTDNSGNEDGFVVSRGTASGGPYTDVGTVGANVTSFNDTGLSEGVVYYYIVRSSLNGVRSSNSNQASARTSVNDIIIDNVSAAVTGTWSTGTSALDKYGADYRFKGKGTGAAYVTFTPSIVAGGNYRVYEWHAQGSNRTTGAPVTVSYNGGSQTVNVNQTANGGSWVLLGTFNFTAGSSGNVRISDAFADTAAGVVVMADAVKFEFVP